MGKNGEIEKIRKNGGGLRDGEGEEGKKVEK